MLTDFQSIYTEWLDDDDLWLVDIKIKINQLFPYI